MNQARPEVPSVVVRKSSSQNAPPTIPSQNEATLSVPHELGFKMPAPPDPPPPSDFSDMASCGADAYFPSYVENETGTSFDNGAGQGEGGAMGLFQEQQKNYKTPAVPRQCRRRIEGKVSTPRLEQNAVNVVEDKDAKLSTKELVKKCFGFDSDDTGSEADDESLFDISPVRGVMGPPGGNLSESRLSVHSIPDKASSTLVTEKSSAQELSHGPYRFSNLPLKSASRQSLVVRSKKPPSNVRVPPKVSYTAKLPPPRELPCNVLVPPEMPPPKVIDAREGAKAKAVEENGRRTAPSTGSPRAKNKGGKDVAVEPDPVPGCSAWSDDVAAAHDGEDE